MTRGKYNLHNYCTIDLVSAVDNLKPDQTPPEPEWRIPLYRHEGRKEFGKLVALLRNAGAKHTGPPGWWTQKALASRSGVSQTYIGMIERGERIPSLDIVIAILASFDLLWETSDPNSRLAPPTAVNDGRSVYFEFTPPRDYGFFPARTRVSVWIDVKPEERPYQSVVSETQGKDRAEDAALEHQERQHRIGVVVDAITRYPEILNTFYPEIQERLRKADADVQRRGELEDYWANMTD